MTKKCPDIFSEFTPMRRRTSKTAFGLISIGKLKLFGRKCDFWIATRFWLSSGFDKCCSKRSFGSADQFNAVFSQSNSRNRRRRIEGKRPAKGTDRCTMEWFVGRRPMLVSGFFYWMGRSTMLRNETAKRRTKRFVKSVRHCFASELLSGWKSALALVVKVFIFDLETVTRFVSHRQIKLGQNRLVVNPKACRSWCDLMNGLGNFGTSKIVCFLSIQSDYKFRLKLRRKAPLLVMLVRWPVPSETESRMVTAENGLKSNPFR